MKHALIPKEWGETLELDTEGGEPEEYVEERQRLLLSDLLPPNWRKQSNMVLPSKLTTHITDFFDKLTKVVGGKDKVMEHVVPTWEEEDIFERTELFLHLRGAAKKENEEHDWLGNQED